MMYIVPITGNVRNISADIFRGSCIDCLTRLLASTGEDDTGRFVGEATDAEEQACVRVVEPLEADPRVSVRRHQQVQVMAVHDEHL